MKNTVKVERAILDITQQQLADAIGVSRNTINSIESGKYVPSTPLRKAGRYHLPAGRQRLTKCLYLVR